MSQLRDAARCIARDERVLLLGIMQARHRAALRRAALAGGHEDHSIALPSTGPHTTPSVALNAQALFEGAMYTFVFLWTPALAPAGERIPHGFIFATFMLASMAGSAVAGLCFARRVAPEAYMPLVFLAAGACMLVPVGFHLTRADSGGDGGDDGDGAVSLAAPDISPAGMLQCIAFCAFEACIGAFWPSMMRVRATVLPDELRSTLINIFRIPLNLFVCLVLANVARFPLAVMFTLCALFMFVAAACCTRFARLQAAHAGAAGASTPSGDGAAGGSAPGEGKALLDA